MIDITGNTYGYLTAIEPVWDDNGANLKWKCQCACGNYVYVGCGALRSGSTQSCGCLKFSVREHLIADELTKYNVAYSTEKTFPGLVDPDTNGRLRFDFAIHDDNDQIVALIEHQGKQHFERVDFIHHQHV